MGWTGHGVGVGDANGKGDQWDREPMSSSGSGANEKGPMSSGTDESGDQRNGVPMESMVRGC